MAPRKSKGDQISVIMMVLPSVAVSTHLSPRPEQVTSTPSWSPPRNTHSFALRELCALTVEVSAPPPEPPCPYGLHVLGRGLLFGSQLYCHGVIEGWGVGNFLLSSPFPGHPCVCSLPPVGGSALGKVNRAWLLLLPTHSLSFTDDGPGMN